MSKKWWIVAVVVVLVAALGFAGYQRISARRAVAETPAEETAVVRRGTLLVTVGATGSLVPHAEVSLAFTSGGRVAEVLVEEGQVVEDGQPLARLETDDLTLQAAQAEITLRQAEIQLETLLEPPDQADIERAQDAVDQAAAALRLAQINYDGAQDSVVVNEALEDAQSAYEEALNDYNYWLNEYNEGDADYWFVDDAQETLDDAQLALERVRQQADQILQSASNDLARAADAYRQAQTDLDSLLAGPDEHDVEAAELQVDQSRVALEQARLRLEQATLTAPMAGTVTALNVQPGEMVSAGQPAVVLSDLTALEVEINLDETDVAQVSVGQEAQVILDAFPDVELTGEVAYIAPVAQAQAGVVLYPVTIRLALADPSTGRRGEFVEPPGQALPVRAGMTADVTIAVASKENALIVPLRAIETEGEQAYVQRLAGGQTERVEVTLGMMTGVEVEITGGLSEGHVVVVVAGPAQGSTVEMGGLGDIFGGGE